MKNEKYDLIKPNEYGRRLTVRFKQYEYTEPIESTNWIIKKNGCGPSSLATVLASLGYKEDPISISKKMFLMSMVFYLMVIMTELMEYQLFIV